MPWKVGVEMRENSQSNPANQALSNLLQKVHKRSLSSFKISQIEPVGFLKNLQVLIYQCLLYIGDVIAGFTRALSYLHVS